MATRIRLQKLKPSTQTQYMAAFNHFAQWLDECGDAQAAGADALDRQLELFAEWVFATGGGSGRQTAACARFACIWLNPRLKRELPLSLAATGQSAWYRAAGRVVQSHRPIPWPVACLVAHHLTAAGHTGAGVAVIVAFDALLRVSEAASLRLDDVADTGMVDARLPSRVVLSIRAPKTGDDSKGERQSVTLRDPVAVMVLREFVASQRATSGPGRPLFGLDAHTLERLFCDAADALGGSVHFTWHSLRHGGATYLSMAQVSAEEICAHGRWVAIGSLKRYLQTGAAVIASHGLGVDVMARAERVAAALRSACA